MADISSLLEKLAEYENRQDIELVEKAAAFAEKAHEGQKRLSGDPYITHPIAVAEILAGLEQDAATICATLLHDTIEDAHVSEEALRKEFGDNILDLVRGVTKLGKISFESREEHQAENFRKMFIAMAEDIRIIIIKLADRLHNMKTLKYLPESKQLEISRETMEIYAPLAHRLGMWNLKWELEDLSFFYLERDKFDQIKTLVSQKREEREQFMNDFMESVRTLLARVGITASIHGRSKHFYSIYNKLVQKNVEFDDIYDLIAIRVIVDSVKDCYAVLGVVHSTWKPIPGRFRDFIALPKSNGYQTLHTTVMGTHGKPVEIQIRTKEMHKVAEYGVAAHWKYKDGSSSDKNFDNKLSWVRQMLEYQKEVKSAKDFLENIKFDLFIDEVFVYSPKGDVYDLPAGSTPVDFAYHVHTQVGHRCVGAKANGKIIQLDHVLKNGDIVQILTSKEDQPRLGWLEFVRTSGAKAKIKQWFKKQKREENIARGRTMLSEELAKLDIRDESLLSQDLLEHLAKTYSVSGSDDLFSFIGHGEISAFQAAKEARKKLEAESKISPIEKEAIPPKQKADEHKKKTSDRGVRVHGLDNVLIRLSKCCFPLPGDRIVGFVTKGRGISVHRADCANVASDFNRGQNAVNVEWELDAATAYPVNIEVEAFDRVGVFKDILAQVSETKTNIASAEIRSRRGSSAFINMVIDVKSVENLKDVIDSIKKVADVYDVYRVSSNK